MNAKLTINNNRTAATAGDNTLYSEKRPSACVRVCASWSVTREDTTAAKKNDKRIQTHTRSRVQREKTRRKSIPGHACRSIVFVTSALVSDSMYYVSASRFANTQNIGSNMSVMCRCIEFSQYQHAVCCMLYAVYERIEPRRKFQCSKWPGSMPWQTVLNTNNNNESNVIEVNVFCVLLFFFFVFVSFLYFELNWSKWRKRRNNAFAKEENARSFIDYHPLSSGFGFYLCVARRQRKFEKFWFYKRIELIWKLNECFFLYRMHWMRNQRVFFFFFVFRIFSIASFDGFLMLCEGYWQMCCTTMRWLHPNHWRRKSAGKLAVCCYQHST